MGINTSDGMLVGDYPEDIAEYLKAHLIDAYDVHEVRLAKCKCGSMEFELEVDDEEGAVRRTCVGCRKAQGICDSGEYWDESNPPPWKCVKCGSNRANVGVGFSLYDDDPTGIRWLYVGARCLHCGILGCVTEWKVALSDARYLIEEV